MNRASLAYKSKAMTVVLSLVGRIITDLGLALFGVKNADGGYDHSFMFKDPEMTEDDLDTSDTAAGYLDMQSETVGYV